MKNFVTCLHLLTPLHTGGSSQEGNLMGIAREIHTEFPYLPASSLRGKIRAELEAILKEETNIFFGQKIQDGNQPTEGEVWFADASLIAFPIASLTHHLVWITCPLWLSRLNRWLSKKPLIAFVKEAQKKLANSKSALTTFNTSEIYLQTAILRGNELEEVDLPNDSELDSLFDSVSLIDNMVNKLVIVSDEDCIALVETGLQREVRVALNENSKTTKDGSFRSEEAIPPEALLFFPWGIKSPENQEKTAENQEKTALVEQKLIEKMGERLQFGGLESLGRGWSDLTTIEVNKKEESN
jgi:CRISPR-associated protein Cmr4